MIIIWSYVQLVHFKYGLRHVVWQRLTNKTAKDTTKEHFRASLMFSELPGIFRQTDLQGEFQLVPVLNKVYHPDVRYSNDL